METLTIVETEDSAFVLCNEGQLNKIHCKILKTTIFSIDTSKILIEILDNNKLEVKRIRILKSNKLK